MRRRHADGFAFAGHLEVQHDACGVLERAGGETAFAFFKRRARFDGEDYGWALGSHLWHVEVDVAADVCAVVFDPFGTAEQFNCDPAAAGLCQRQVNPPHIRYDGPGRGRFHPPWAPVTEQRHNALAQIDLFDRRRPARPLDQRPGNKASTGPAGPVTSLGVTANHPTEASVTVGGVDWSGYIAKQLRLAGFRGGELEEHLHHIVAKLLVTPGKLFHGWHPQQHGPLDRRFGASVRNEIANIISKQSNRRRYIPTVSITNDFHGHGVAEKYLPPARSQEDSLLSDFSDWLSTRLGPLAVAVLTARLHGDDTTTLVGDERLGRPTRNKLKTTLQAIKQAASEYADGDASLRSRIEELLDQDRQRAERMRVARARAEA